MKPPIDEQLGLSHQRIKAESLMRMAGGMAHDFNNYLAAIQGNNELVEAQSTTDAPFTRSVRQIHSLTDSALGLTHRIQVFSGQAQVQPEACEPIAFLKEHTAALQALASPSHTLAVILPQTCEPVRVDPALLGHALQNLVTNAGDALVDQAGEISVSYGEIPRGGCASVENFHHIPLEADRYAYFEVCDNGPGMDESTTSKIFDPFFTTKIRAEGMGLPVVLGIAWSHKGGVQLSTAPGKGTRIRILLPL